MANALKTLFLDIADAIRNKTGDTGTMKPADFPTKISEIQTGTSDEALSNTLYGLVAKNEEYTSGKEELLMIPQVITNSGNNLGNLAEYALAGFKYAKYAKINGIGWIYDYALAYNPNLQIVEFEYDVETFALGFILRSYSLYNDTLLESIIIRYDGDTLPESTADVFLGNGLGDTGVLYGTNNTFYVYVSSILYDMTVANNPNFSSRIRKLEDYPDIDNWYENL